VKTTEADSPGNALQGAPALHGVATGIGAYRWRICALLFFATTIYYVDRQVLGVLAPVLQKSSGWNEIQYGRLWSAVALVGLGAASHQGWSANLFTLASDMFPRRAVASVTGIGGFGGAIGGMVIARITGFLLQVTGSYVPVFVMSGSVYLLALLIVHLLAPRLVQVRID
jgi:nitrate/nitrite transporter NarK